jgi:hypothetical protein
MPDALRLTHFLHANLIRSRHCRRRPPQARSCVQPYPDPTDVRDACDLHGNSTALQATCDIVFDSLSRDVGYKSLGPGASDLAERLNELYDVAPSLSDRATRQHG